MKFVLAYQIVKLNKGLSTYHNSFISIKFPQLLIVGIKYVFINIKKIHEIEEIIKWNSWLNILNQEDLSLEFSRL